MAGQIGEAPSGGTYSAGPDTQASVWSERARDWADLVEAHHRPLYTSVLDEVGLGKDQRLLDVGCGSGTACSIAAARGANVSGIDASPALIAIAKGRPRSGEFRIGTMEKLPYPDGAFDVVTFFNSIMMSRKPEKALMEASRVAETGSPIAVVVLAGTETSAAVKGLLSFAAAPEQLPLNLALEKLAAQAGLVIQRSRRVSFLIDYPDLETALRASTSGGLAVLAERRAGKEAVRRFIAETLAGMRTSEGAYRTNMVYECHILRRLQAI